VTIVGFVNLYGCEIGDDFEDRHLCRDPAHATSAAARKVSSHYFICAGVTIEVRVLHRSPRVFTNDRYPRAVNADGVAADRRGLQVIRRMWRGAPRSAAAPSSCVGERIGEGRVVGARQRRDEGRAAPHDRRRQPGARPAHGARILRTPFNTRSQRTPRLAECPAPSVISVTSV
jgi:hypothetical protein